MAKKTDNEVLALLDKLAKQIVADSPSKKKADCQYLLDTEGRYCLATTNKSCARCKQFSPTVMSQVRRVLLNNDELEEDIKQLKVDMANLNSEIARKDMIIMVLQAELAEMRGEEDGQGEDGEESAPDTDGKADVEEQAVTTD